MTGRRRTAGRLAGLGATLLALAGCAPSEEDKRRDRAQYVRGADITCLTTNVSVARSSQPLSLASLQSSVERDGRMLGRSASVLHDRHDDLGGSSSPAIDRFDERIDAVVAAHARVAKAAGAGDEGGVRRAAEALREASAELYRLARAAGLKQCGRGGNRAADRALFTVYREEIRVINKTSTSAEKRLRRQLNRLSGSSDFGGYVRVLGGYIGLFERYLRRIARTGPPREARSLHRLLQRRTRSVVASAKDFRVVLRQGVGAIDIAELEAAVERMDRNVERASATEERLLALLNRGARPRPGGEPAQAS